MTGVSPLPSVPPPSARRGLDTALTPRAYIFPSAPRWPSEWDRQAPRAAGPPQPDQRLLWPPVFASAPWVQVSSIRPPRIQRPPFLGRPGPRQTRSSLRDVKARVPRVSVPRPGAHPRPPQRLHSCRKLPRRAHCSAVRPFAHSANGWAPTTGGHSALLFSVLTPCLRCCRDPHSAGEQTAAR